MKKTISHFVLVGHIGAALSFVGCMLLLILHNPLQLIHFTILSPLLYLLLCFLGNREQVWYDESEMTGSLAAITYIYSTFLSICIGYKLFQQHEPTIVLIFILLGNLLVSIRFYLNSWLQCSALEEYKLVADPITIRR